MLLIFSVIWSSSAIVPHLLLLYLGQARVHCTLPLISWGWLAHAARAAWDYFSLLFRKSSSSSLCFFRTESGRLKVSFLLSFILSQRSVNPTNSLAVRNRTTTATLNLLLSVPHILWNLWQEKISGLTGGGGRWGRSPKIMWAEIDLNRFHQHGRPTDHMTRTVAWKGKQQQTWARNSGPELRLSMIKQCWKWHSRFYLNPKESSLRWLKSSVIMKMKECQSIMRSGTWDENVSLDLTLMDSPWQA